MNQCPKCKLYSSNEIDLCDCGFRFSTQSFDSKNQAIGSEINKKASPALMGKSLLKNLTSINFLSFWLSCFIYKGIEQYGFAFVSVYGYLIENELGLFFHGPFTAGLTTLFAFYLVSALLCFIPWVACRLLKRESNFGKWVSITKWVLLGIFFLNLLGR